MCGYVHSCEVCVYGEAMVYLCMHMYSWEVCVFKCMYACMRTHSKVCVQVYICVYMYTVICAQVHVYIDMNMAVTGLCTRAYVCVQVSVYI